MKKLSVIVALISVLGLSACSSGSDWTAVQYANNAISALNNITDNWTCTSTTFTTCQCPGGGDAVFSGIMPTTSTTKAEQTVRIHGCTDNVTGLSFTGTWTFDDDTGLGTVDFSTFGQCENFDGTFDSTGDTCSGTATGTCQGEALTCNWTLSGDDCICGTESES